MMVEPLIDAVKSHRALYDIHHTDYLNSKLKDAIWEQVAEEVDIESGTAAKDAWLKLRNCHRDALRRQKRCKAKGGPGTVIKQWRYQNQMEFLLPFMVNRDAITNILDDINEMETHQEEPSLDEDNTCAFQDVEVKYEFPSPENDVFVMVAEPPRPSPDKPRKRKCDDKRRESNKKEYFGKYDGHLLETNKIEYCDRDDSKLSESFQNDYCERVPRDSILSQESFSTSKIHSVVKKEEPDPLYHFFMAMYAMVAKMPPTSQHRVKKEVFEVVSSAEESLLISSSD